jgi:hypothetical protein
LTDADGNPNGAGREPAADLMRRLGGKWVVQALATAAQLRIPESLSEPKTIDELASKLGCEPDPLFRLLRVLSGEGIVELESDGRYHLTPMGVHLRQESLGRLAEFVASPSQWAPWTELAYSVRTGHSAFERTHGQSLFDYLESHPDEARLYDDAVDAFTTEQAEAFAALDVFDEIGTLVDVGGGRGTLLAALLRLRPGLRGVLFDRPHVVASAQERFTAEGLADRCEFVGGDFFESVPAGADAYVIKHVLHNWDDERAAALLRRCAEAAGARGRVLAIDAIVLPGNRPDFARLIDLEMLAVTEGGKERSKPELRRLFSAAGLRLTSTRRLSEGAWLMMSEPR